MSGHQDPSGQDEKLGYRRDNFVPPKYRHPGPNIGNQMFETVSPPWNVRQDRVPLEDGVEDSR